MHRFFYKVFLWFWLGIIVVGTTVVALTASTHSRASEDEHWIQKYGPRVDLWARQESEILDREGTSALKAYVNSFESDPGVRNYLFDAGSQEMLRRQAPERVLQAVALMASSTPSKPRFFTKERIIGERIFGPAGRKLRSDREFPAAVNPATATVSIPYRRPWQGGDYPTWRRSRCGGFFLFLVGATNY